MMAWVLLFLMTIVGLVAGVILTVLVLLELKHFREEAGR